MHKILVILLGLSLIGCDYGAPNNGRIHKLQKCSKWVFDEYYYRSRTFFGEQKRETHKIFYCVEWSPAICVNGLEEVKCK